MSSFIRGKADATFSKGILPSSAANTSSIPTAPSALTATAIYTASKRVDLSWTDNSSDETAFAVFKSTDNVTYSEIATTAAGATSYSVTSGLTEDTLTYFKVAARNAGGDSALTSAASATPRILPSDISGLLRWWKADGLAFANGANVTSVSDSSGNGGTASKATTNIPTYATDDGDGKPAVKHSLVAAQWLQFSAITTARSVFIIYKDASTAGYVTFLGGLSNGSGSDFFHGHSDNTQMFNNPLTCAETRGGVCRKDRASFNPLTTARPNDGYHLFTFILSGTSTLRDLSRIGDDDDGSRTIRGGWREILIFDTDVGSTNRDKIELYMKSKWGTP